MRSSKISSTARYALGFAIGLVIFVAAPESARWFHGGAIAQQTLGTVYGLPPNTTVGTVIQGQSGISVTTGPGQTGTIVGGETNVTTCPGQGNVVGTYVGPGSSMNVTVNANGGSGSVTGYRSSVTVGGPGC
jgi:hypothetical protein